MKVAYELLNSSFKSMLTEPVSLMAPQHASYKLTATTYPRQDILEYPLNTESATTIAIAL